MSEKMAGQNMLKALNENFDFPAEQIEKKLSVVIYAQADEKTLESIEPCYNAKII